MKKSLCLLLSCIMLITSVHIALAVTVSDIVLYNFESGATEGLKLTAGLPDHVISEDTICKYNGEPFNQEGGYFLTTFGADGDGKDQYTGEITSELFDVTFPILSLRMGGGKTNVYFAVCDEQGNEMIKINNYVNSDTMTNRAVDISMLSGKQAYIKIVDRATESWGHILVDDIRLTSGNSSEVGADQGYLLYADFDADDTSALNSSNNFAVVHGADGNGKLKNTNGNGSQMISFGQPTWRNYAVTVRLKLDNHAETGMISFRISSTGEKYWVEFTPSGKIAVKKITNGVTTVLGEGKGTFAGFTEVTIIINGNNILIVQDNMPVLELSDSDGSTQGNAEIGVTNGLIEIDKIIVQKPEAKERQIRTVLSTYEKNGMPVNATFEADDKTKWVSMPSTHWQTVRLEDGASTVLENTMDTGSPPLCTIGNKYWKNYRVTADIKPISGAGIAFIRVRSDGAAGGHNFVLYGNGKIELKTDGVTHKTGSIPLELGVQTSIKIMVQDDHIQFFANNQKIVDHYLSSYGRGMVAIGTWEMKAQFDNIAVTPLESAIPVTDIQTNYDSNKTINMKLGDTISLDAKVLPSNATTQELVYTSSNYKAVIPYMDGRIRAVEPGMAEISVMTSDGSMVKAFSVTSTGAEFADLTDHWAKGKIEVAAAQGIVQGDDGAFHPDEQVSRAQLVAMVCRLAGLTAEEGTSYDDVSDSSWYAGYLAAAKNNGLIDGGMISKNNFRPDQAATRAEIAAMCAKVYQRQTGLEASAADLGAFSDLSDIPPWAVDALELAYGLGVISGTTKTKMNPKASATRAETAVMLERTHEKFSQGQLLFGTMRMGLRASLKLYEPGQPILYYFGDTGQTAHTVKVSFVDALTKETVSKVYETKPGLWEIEDSFSTETKGVYRVQFTLLDEKEKVLHETGYNVGVCYQFTEPADKSLYFGIQTQTRFIYRWADEDRNLNQMSRDESFDYIIESAKWLGANLWRDGGDLSQVTKDTDAPVDTWTYGYFLDKFFATGKDAGVTIDFHELYTGTKPMEKYKDVAKEIAWRYPKDLDSMVKWADVTSKRYAKNDIIWEIGNELNWPSFNLGTPEEVAERLEAIARKIKENIPDAKITVSGLVIQPDNDDPVYYAAIKKLLDEGVLTYYAYHSHTYFDDFEKRIWPIAKSYLEKNGINWMGHTINNEVGYQTGNGDIQAYEVIRKILYGYGNHHVGNVFYRLYEFPLQGQRVRDGNPPPQDWALLSYDGEPNEAFIAYNNLIRQLNGTQTVVSIANDGVFAYLFEKDGESVVTLFGDNTVKATYTLSQTPDEAVDMYGNKISTDGSISRYPVYLKFKGKIGSDVIKIKR